jgi:hypothetical protein
VGHCSSSRTLSDLATAGSGLGAGAAPRERGTLMPERETMIDAPSTLSALMAGMMR